MDKLIVRSDEVVIKIPVTMERQEFSLYLFYGEFLEVIHQYYTSFKKLFDKKLVLDFSSVKSIDPLVFPNLLNVGIGLNKLHLSETEITNVSGEAACFMSVTGFKSLAEKEQIFRFDNFDSYNIGEWTAKLSNARIYLHYFKYPEHFLEYHEYDFENYPNIQQRLFEYIAEEIHEDKRLVINLLNKSAEDEAKSKVYFEQAEGELAIALASSGSDRRENSANFFKCILENVKNALIHGGKGCIVFLYAYPIKTLGKDKVYISVSDIGVGITDSIEIKPEKELLFNEHEIKAFESRKDLNKEEKAYCTHNYRCILESIFYRAKLHKNTDKYKEYGLFDVINSTLNDADEKTKNDRRVYIHSDRVRLCLTNHFYNQYLLPCIKGQDNLNLQKIVKTLSKDVYSFDDQRSYLKLSERFGGTHIEYEFFD